MGASSSGRNRRAAKIRSRVIDENLFRLSAHVTAVQAVVSLDAEALRCVGSETGLGIDRRVCKGMYGQDFGRSSASKEAREMVGACDFERSASGRSGYSDTSQVR